MWHPDRITEVECLSNTPWARRMTQAHPQMVVAVVSREKVGSRLIQPPSVRCDVAAHAPPCKHDIKVFRTYISDENEGKRRGHHVGPMRHIGTPQGMGLVLGTDPP